MIDLHTHVLPGLDDGPATLEDAVALLRAAAGGGVTAVVATPHVSARYPVTPEEIESSLASVGAAVAAAGVELDLLPGAEVEVAWLGTLEDGTVDRLTLGGSGRYLLVELPWDSVHPETVRELQRLGTRGIRPVIAHPERYVYVQEAPGLLSSLTETGALVQVTVSSLLGDHGRTAAASARLLLDHGLVHVLASDVHGSGVRRAPLAAAAGVVGDRPLLDWLTRDVPAAVIRGDDPPLRPRARPRVFGRR